MCTCKILFVAQINPPRGTFICCTNRRPGYTNRALSLSFMNPPTAGNSHHAFDFLSEVRRRPFSNIGGNSVFISGSSGGGGGDCVSGKRRRGRGVATCPYWATQMIHTRTCMLRLTGAVSTTCVVLLIAASLATRRGGDWSNNTLGSIDTTATTTLILTKPAQHYLFDKKV